MATAFDTDAVPDSERFAYYREAVLGALYPMTPELDDHEGFHVHFDVGGVADALAVHCRGTPHRIGRTPRDIAAAASDCYFIFEQIAPSPLRFVPHGLDGWDIAPGDLVIGDADTAFETPKLGRYDHRFWMLPKRLIDPVLPGAPDMLGRPVRLAGAAGMGALLGGYLATLAAQADHPDVAANGGVAANLGHLMAITLGTARADAPQRMAVSEARRRQALAWIERRFGDPELSASEVAARLGVSIRTLHAAFEPSGTSFAEALTLRRLQAAHAALTNKAARDQSVAAIAFACGFNDVSTFYRAFRRIYGAAPSDLRP